MPSDYGTEGYRFEPCGLKQSDDVAEQTIGEISGVAKAGWQYLWVQYRETDDADAKMFARRPVAVYVEKVYDSTSFSPLGIGE